MHYHFDAANPPPAAGPNAVLDLADADTVFLGTTIYTASVRGIRGAGHQHVLIASTGVLDAQLNAIELQGDVNTVLNDGVVNSVAGLAIAGSGGADSIINTGTLHANGTTLIDLGGGMDLYDGTLGVASGAIRLGAGDDTAYGGAGAEIFSGGDGNDSIDGGGGNDTVDYADATGTVFVDLRTTSWQFTGQGMDLLLGIENVIGSAQNDTLIGGTNDNNLQGGNGDDILEGGAGTDVLVGGGQGTAGDTARYTGTAAAYVSLAFIGAQNTIGYGYDTLIGIENLEGGSAADNLTGDAGANRLVGNAGNDTLIGGAGNDTLDGGTGQDTASFSGNRSAYTWTANSDGTFTVIGPDGSDLLKDIRFLKFQDETVALENAAPSAVSLSATSVLESARPGAAVATIFGQDPDGDALTFSLVSDAGGLFALNSGKLVLARALDYETAAQHSVSIKAVDAYGGETVKSLTVTVRNVVETTPLTLSGTAGNDVTFGEAGNDRLFGNAGNDQLSGEDGNDILRGGQGNDILIGGAGNDFFVLDAKPNVRTNVDWLYDFNTAQDTVHLMKSVFTKLSRKGFLSKDAFYVGAHVHDSSDRIFYNKKTGALFYDPDGTGHAVGLQIATMPKGLALTYKDFYVI